MNRMNKQTETFKCLNISLGLSSEAEVCVHVKYDDGWLDRLPQVSMCIICSILLTFFLYPSVLNNIVDTLFLN